RAAIREVRAGFVEIPSTLDSGCGENVGAGTAGRLRFFNVNNSNLTSLRGEIPAENLLRVYQSRRGLRAWVSMGRSTKSGSVCCFADGPDGWQGCRLRAWRGRRTMAAFEERLTQLESVVEKLERGELSLEESVRLF